MYYAGQGRVYLAETINGKIGKFFDIGNCPKVVFHLSGEDFGKILIDFQEFFPESEKLFFGNASIQSNTSVFISVCSNDFKNKFPNTGVRETNLRSDIPVEYHLVYEGYNTAKDRSLIRIDFNKVIFKPCKVFTAVSDDYETFNLEGKFLKDGISGNYGKVYIFETPSNNPLTNFLAP